MPLPLGLAAVDLAMGALGIGGSMMTNASSRAEAERNRRFQERMSSTAAQRAVKDYEAAGLNPALAYDKPASSPGGATAPISDAVGAGISTALAAKTAKAQIAAADAQTHKARVEAAGAEQDVLFKQNTLAERQLTAIAEQRFLRSMMPINLDIRENDRKLQRYSLPETFGEKYLDRFRSVIGLTPFGKLPGFQEGRGPSMKFEALPSWSPPVMEPIRGVPFTPARRPK